MALTQDQYDALAGILTSPVRRTVTAFAGRELRDTPRSQARGPAELVVRTVGGTQQATVYVHDISLGGVGIMSAVSARTGSKVEVRLSNGYDDLALHCTVRHCTAIAVDLFGIGLNVVTCDVRQTNPASPASEALAAWSGFFAGEIEASRQQ